MGSLINIDDYFKGNESLKGYPYQGSQDRPFGSPEGNLTVQPTEKRKSEKPYGYYKDKVVNKRSKK